jgi:hypothetical protein
MSAGAESQSPDRMAMTTTQRKTSEYASLSPEAVLSDAVAGPEQARPFEVRVKGKTLYVPSVQVQGRRVITTGRWLRIAAIHDEELVEEEPVPDPEAFLRSLRRARLKCDIFTFAQRLPETAPRFKYCMEWDNYAVIPITTLADWEKRVASDVRKALRRARREGVEVRLSKLDDAFVAGICDIYNESPVRQGKPFWQYHKDFETVRRENSTYPERSAVLGAYYNNELIGFIKMVFVGNQARTFQVIGKKKYFDKKPVNALIAKAVEICELTGTSYLIYGSFMHNQTENSLTQFKRRNGFEQLLLPRYYLPLTLKGKIALRLGLHHGMTALIPKPALRLLLKLRAAWYARPWKAEEGDPR